MSRFGGFESKVSPSELAVFEQAYQDACRKLHLRDGDDDCKVQDWIAASIIEAAKLGERDPLILSAFAVAANWGRPKADAPEEEQSSE